MEELKIVLVSRKQVYNNSNNLSILISNRISQIKKFKVNLKLFLYMGNGIAWPPTDESSLAIPIDEIREVKSSLGASFGKQQKGDTHLNSSSQHT